ncbi:hypothetical protein [Amycolatopsis sp. NPDC051716]|uniref:hypothetical protein n=1 Tax=Actinomycetes TaxID=1760 RepID=UPI0034449B8A
MTRILIALTIIRAVRRAKPLRVALAAIADATACEIALEMNDHLNEAHNVARRWPG